MTTRRDARPFDPSSPVLVGIDGTKGSRHALEWATDLARRLSARLELVHADSPWIGLEFAIPPLDVDAHRAAVKTAVDEWAETVEGIPHDTKIIEDKPANAVLLVGDEIDASLTVLGARGADGWFPHLLGSVASTVLHRADRPVCIVAEEAGIPVGEGRIVVGVDGSEPARRALEWGASLGAMLGVAVHAVCAVPYDRYSQWPSLAPEDSADVPSDTVGALRALIGEVSDAAGIPVEGDVLIGHPAQQLLSETDAADMLVVGATGHSPFADLLVGSTTRTCATYGRGVTAVIP